jgi:hypothetical protein
LLDKVKEKGANQQLLIEDIAKDGLVQRVREASGGNVAEKTPAPMEWMEI